MNKFTGYMGNVLEGNNNRKIATAMNGNFYNGYTVMYMSDLIKGVEGRDKLMDANLNELLKHKKSLKSGKQVNVYLEWQLTDDEMEYKNVSVVRVEEVEVKE